MEYRSAHPPVCVRRGGTGSEEEGDAISDDPFQRVFKGEEATADRSEVTPLAPQGPPTTGKRRASRSDRSLRRHGDDAFKLLVFENCSDGVKHIVREVARLVRDQQLVGYAVAAGAALQLVAVVLSTLAQ